MVKWKSRSLKSILVLLARRSSYRETTVSLVSDHIVVATITMTAKITGFHMQGVGTEKKKDSSFGSHHWPRCQEPRVIRGRFFQRIKKIRGCEHALAASSSNDMAGRKLSFFNEIMNHVRTRKARSLVPKGGAQEFLNEGPGKQQESFHYKYITH